MNLRAIGRALTRARQEVWFFWRTRKPLNGSLWAMSSLDAADRELLTERVRSDYAMRMTAETSSTYRDRSAWSTCERWFATCQGDESCMRAFQRAAPERWAFYHAAAATLGEPEDQRLEIAEAELERRRAEAEQIRRSYRLE